MPLIANAVGGIVDYAREGETAWLNRSCTGDELARIMMDLVEHPDRVGQMSSRVCARRASIIKLMAHHANEMAVLYGDLIDARAGSAGYDRPS